MNNIAALNQFVSAFAKKVSATDSVISRIGSAEKVEELTRNVFAATVKDVSFILPNGAISCEACKVAQTMLVGEAAEIRRRVEEGEAFLYNKALWTWEKITKYEVRALLECGDISIHLETESGWEDKIRICLSVANADSWALKMIDVRHRYAQEAYIHWGTWCIYLSRAFINHYEQYDMSEREKLS